jgi:hypothetical protein
VCQALGESVEAHDYWMGRSAAVVSEASLLSIEDYCEYAREVAAAVHRQLVAIAIEHRVPVRFEEGGTPRVPSVDDDATVLPTALVYVAVESRCLGDAPSIPSAALAKLRAVLPAATEAANGEPTPIREALLLLEALRLHARAQPGQTSRAAALADAVDWNAVWDVAGASQRALRDALSEELALPDCPFLGGGPDATLRLTRLCLTLKKVFITSPHAFSAPVRQAHHRSMLALAISKQSAAPPSAREVAAFADANASNSHASQQNRMKQRFASPYRILVNSSERYAPCSRSLFCVGVLLPATGPSGTPRQVLVRSLRLQLPVSLPPEGTNWAGGMELSVQVRALPLDSPAPRPDTGNIFPSFANLGPIDFAFDAVTQVLSPRMGSIAFESVRLQATAFTSSRAQIAAAVRCEQMSPAVQRSYRKLVRTEQAKAHQQTVKAVRCALAAQQQEQQQQQQQEQQRMQ